MMMHYLSKPALAALAAAISLTSAPSIGAAESSPNQLKAAIVFNIIRFVEFAPGDVGTTLNLCASRKASGLRELSALNGQRVGNRRIAYRTIDAGRFADCNVIYLGSASTSEISQASGTGVLVIGDGSSFIGNGGAVGLVRMGNQLRFEMNTRTARTSKVKISSKLLRLAARVQQ